MVTRSQQWAANNKAKKYSLRQSRSSGSDTEANGEISRGFCTSEPEHWVSCWMISTFYFFRDVNKRKFAVGAENRKIIGRIYVFHSCIEALWSDSVITPCSHRCWSHLLSALVYLGWMNVFKLIISSISEKIDGSGVYPQMKYDHFHYPDNESLFRCEAVMQGGWNA